MKTAIDSRIRRIESEIRPMIQAIDEEPMPGSLGRTQRECQIAVLEWAVRRIDKGWKGRWRNGEYCTEGEMRIWRLILSRIADYLKVPSNPGDICPIQAFQIGGDSQHGRSSCTKQTQSRRDNPVQPISESQVISGEID